MENPKYTCSSLNFLWKEQEGGSIPDLGLTTLHHQSQGFPDSSVGKESAWNAGNPGSISGLGGSTGDRIGYPLQYSWASLVAQLVKNLPAMRETWVQSLDWEDALEKEKATHSSILAWRILWTIYSPWGIKESDTTEQLSLSLHHQSPTLQEYEMNILPVDYYVTICINILLLSGH